jgi:uncharacterized delta-60 repeat protein
MILDGTGRIVVAGSSTNGAGDLDMAIWRYDGTGALDTSFGGQGWVTHHDAAGGNGDDGAEAVILDSSDRIIVAGWSLNATADMDMVVWRYDPSGTLDPIFGPGGLIVQGDAAGGNGDDFGYGVALDRAGRILVGGSSSNGSDLDMAIWSIE